MLLRPRSSRILFAALVVAGYLATGAPGVLSSDSAAAQVTPLEEEADEAPDLGRITGSPDAGPSPEDAGDRGGAAQLLLAGVLVFGLLFIASRIWKDVRPKPRGRTSDIDGT